MLVLLLALSTVQRDVTGRSEAVDEILVTFPLSDPDVLEGEVCQTEAAFVCDLLVNGLLLAVFSNHSLNFVKKAGTGMSNGSKPARIDSDVLVQLGDLVV